MKQIEFDLNGKKVNGLEAPLPGAPLVLAYGEKGFVMCGYLNIMAAEKMGVAAALVRGVSSVGELLNAEVQALTSQAEKKGVKLGMTGKEALSHII